MRTRSLPASGEEGDCARFDVDIARLGTPALDAAAEAELRAHLAACARCAELADLFDSGVEEEGLEEAPAAELAVATVIADRYRLERVLGRGGMGVVWAATQLRTGQPVAVKLLDARSGDPRARRRLVREARAASAVRHPNVVRVHDVLELADGAPALVMERLDGCALQRCFDRGPVSIGALCHVLARVAAAAAAAHAVGIVHRDLKPDNVFLARTAAGVEVKVLDFGVAKRRGAATDLSGSLTRTGAMVGTPFYMSPEQALGDDDIDARADVWAIGLMLYQGLSGVLPTRADNLGRVIKAVAMTAFAPLDSLVPGLPPDLVELAGRMLQKDREARLRDLEEARAVLARHEGAGIDELLVTEDAPPPDAPACVTATPAPRGRVIRPWMVTAAGTLAIGGAGLAGALLRGPRADGSTASSAIVAPPPPSSSPAPIEVASAIAAPTPSAAPPSSAEVRRRPAAPPRPAPPAIAASAAPRAPPAPTVIEPEHAF